MKAKICVAAIALSGSLVIAFAADQKKAADPCTETYDKAVLSCENAKARCRAGGSDESRCENVYNKCVNDAKKAQADCQNKSGKAGGKPSASPSGSPTRK